MVDTVLKNLPNKILRRPTSDSSLPPSTVLDHRRNALPTDDPIDKTLKQFKIDGLEAFSASTTKVGKIFWVFMIVLATAILIYELYKTIDNYIQSPVVTTYSVQPMNEMDFPDVYICTTNFITQKFVKNQSEHEIKFDQF